MENVEKITLSRNSLEMNLRRELKKITTIEADSDKKMRIIHFPKEFEEQIMKHLRDVYRSECWLLKNIAGTDGMEVEIDLESANVLEII